MHRMAILLILLFILTVFAAPAETVYTVNDQLLSNMTIEELYALEDAVMDAIEEVFVRDTTISAPGDLIGLYVVNPRTKKFHFPYCYSAVQIGTDRRFEFRAASELAAMGYKPCGQCKPYVE